MPRERPTTCSHFAYEVECPATSASPLSTTSQKAALPGMSDRLDAVCFCSRSRTARVAVLAVSNAVLLGFLFWTLPEAVFFLSAFVIDAVVCAAAALGFRFRVPFLLLPNILVKFAAVLLLLFIGCVSFDSFAFHKEVAEWTDAHLRVSHSSGVFAFLLGSLVLLTLEIRVTLIDLFELVFEREEPVDEKPPTYSTCASRDRLPTYAEATGRSPGPSTSQEDAERREKVAVISAVCPYIV